MDDSIEAVALLPCPFCGGTDIRAFDNSVLCNSCSGSGPDLGHCVGPKCLAEAIAAWNRRAEDKNERLRAALITWRNSFESGNVEAIHLAYANGNAALGVPAEVSERECIAVRAFWSRAPARDGEE